METVGIYIKPYLAEYIKEKWGGVDGVISIPSEIYLYHIFWSLLIKQPLGIDISKGNIKIYIPDRKDNIGKRKNPQYYNHVSKNGQLVFQKRLETFFRAELHEFIDSAKHNEGISYKDACFHFLAMYNIQSIDSDSLIKNYSRWKRLIRGNKSSKTYVSS